MSGVYRPDSARGGTAVANTSRWMWSPERILVGSDFSASANAALEVASALARRTGAAIDLIHVVPPSPGPATGYEIVDELLANRSDSNEACRRARIQLEKMAKAAELPESRVEALFGDPAPTLLEQRSRREPDLLVLGARGLRGLRRFVLGSLADRALRQPGCPLLLVNRSPAGGEFKKILVPLELPDEPKPWLRTALTIAHKLRSEVVILHVLPPKGYVSDVRHVELAPESVPERLRSLVTSLDPTIPVEIAVRRGDPATIIPSFAKKLGADLVVMGAERRDDGWPGRVADRVARAALPALLYVWPRPDDTGESDA